MADKSRHSNGHCLKKKLTKKELKMQNHAKLMELKKNKNGGEIQHQVNNTHVDKKAA